MNEYVIIVGYITPNGVRSASYWADTQENILDAVERASSYCKRYPYSTLKIVSFEEALQEQTYENIRKETYDNFTKNNQVLSVWAENDAGQQK